MGGWPRRITCDTMFFMTQRRSRSDKDLPIVINEAEKTWQRDIKPTVHVLSDLAGILFGPRPAVRKTPPAEREPQRSTSVRLPPSQQIVITQVGRANEGRVSASEPPIIEAEIIEENGIPRICPTCGGAGRLGRRGFEVPCPSCNWPADR